MSAARWQASEEVRADPRASSRRSALRATRAADADALPEPLQGAIAEHLEQSAWSRALVEGGAGADAALDAGDQQRLFAKSSVRPATPAVSAWRPWLWIPALAAAAVLVLIVGVLRRSGSDRPFDQRPLPPPESQVAVAQPAPAFTLALDKADVKLTPAALVLRSDGRGARFVDDIAPALDAYRAGDYAEADRRFALSDAISKSVEVAFYRGVSRLFLNDHRQRLCPCRQRDGSTMKPSRQRSGGTLPSPTGGWGRSTRLQVELDSLCRARASTRPERAKLRQRSIASKQAQWPASLRVGSHKWQRAGRRGYAVRPTGAPETDPEFATLLAAAR